MARKLVARPRHPITGRQMWIRARSERELEAYLHRIASLKSDLRLGLSSPADVSRALRRLRHGAVTLERAAQSYVRRPDLAGNTRKRVASVLASPLHALAHLELEALDAPMLAAHFDTLAELRRGTIRQVWRTLRAIVAHAAERGYVADVPWGAWRPRKRLGQDDRDLRDCARNERELRAIIDAASALDDASHGRLYRALAAKIAAAAWLGLRQGELAGLRWYDIYWRRSTVGVRRQWDGAPLKTFVGAELIGPPELFARLEIHRQRQGDPDSGAPVFPSPRGGPYTRGECLASRDLRAVVRAAGLDDHAWSPHSLKDTFTTIEANRCGGDLRALQARTRHRSTSSLVRYLRSFNRELPALGPASP